ncbi:hypothetical protein C5748_19945 [Phyllobacterium phragmitis]|uniref:Uncharacterized protein n=1 Tax=Phyllobacterium phragmitis TaxID=2670329 RepID=A0A2S9IMI1_9HYPH|nr:hypothetical protein C5748_19945 [Phyllobacterium phragmitis]
MAFAIKTEVCDPQAPMVIGSIGNRALRARGCSVAKLYNTIGPHSSLGYKPPAPQAILPRSAGLLYAPLRSANLGDHNNRRVSLQRSRWTFLMGPARSLQQVWRYEQS